MQSKRKDLDTLTKDESHGFLTTYEMRVGGKEPTKEIAFKAFKKGKYKKNGFSKRSSSELDELDAYFKRSQR